MTLSNKLLTILAASKDPMTCRQLNEAAGRDAKGLQYVQMNMKEMATASEDNADPLVEVVGSVPATGGKGRPSHTYQITEAGRTFIAPAAQ